MRDPWGGESEATDRVPSAAPAGEPGRPVWADPWTAGGPRWVGTTAHVPPGDSGPVRLPPVPAPSGPPASGGAAGPGGAEADAPSGGRLPPPVEYPDDWRPRGRRGDGPGRGPAARTPTAPAATPAPGRTGAPKSTGGGGFLARAAAVTAGLTAAGAVLGLVRDQSLAHYFGAGAETDAFLVAWTVPEFASTLLIEDAMALILVPAFSRALTRRGGAVRALVRSTLPRLVLAMSALAGILILAAPLLVAALAPGLPDPRLAVDCTRLTATCVLTFALAGYCSAALRAHGSFLPPAAIYVAYNIGIIGTIVVLREPFGVRAAAAGVAVGGALMVAVQAPYLIRELRGRPAGAQGEGGGDGGRLVLLGLIAPVIAFTVFRQSQILIERFLAAPLPSGAISHLNYAQKVAQMPMMLSLMLCTVSFPVVARAMAAGDTDGARRRVERDLLLAAVVVLVGASIVIAAAPQIVEVLFQRGAFDAGDTAATAAVMRVYALGLLGQTMVGTLVRCYFSAARPLWYPAAAMAAGLAVTAVAGVVGAGLWGAVGIAGANALGITLTAVLMLLGARRQAIPVRIRYLGVGLLRLAAAAVWATAAGWLCSFLITPALLSLTVASVVCAGVFLLLVACAPRAPDIPPLTRIASRRLAHARCHGAPRRRDPSTAAPTTAVGGDVPLDRRHHG
ncbi:murein biosynthesis integral membrane protein MurJ [Streptomyces sp. NPDC090127]|uniref:murein biosynthesis integral membrane protein MurJ n=1 Tax=Streptomyces sp. NPDC090127 TaxID=3365953 RepID=UPI00381BDCC1